MLIDYILEELKPYLKITWDEEDESLLIPSINKGVSKIDGIVGFEINYEKDIEARSLLLDYCRYSYNNASEYFETNFESELIRLQIKYLRLNKDDTPK